ncbi:T9SS outer membrane translocon Sov/SprA [Parachryseolinea silvisoli]|uniref:T9SS outer membrane translocon Sov/SprA n=1 Tax=Parachryseolinea silvisoli TaxID=2873601 RepID=UPI002265D9AB|nr:cell surface protein SprA [Parachryseolinea silvisoli]
MKVFTKKRQVISKLGGLIITCLSIFTFTDEALAQRQDTTRVNAQDTTSRPYRSNRRPTYRPTDRYGDPFSNTSSASPFYLKDPQQMKLDVEIDTSMNYTIYEKIGDMNYRPTSSMTFEEFKQYQDRQALKSYWQSRARAQDGESAVSGRGLIPKIFISPILDRIFGGSYIELIPRGFVTLDFGASFQRNNNPNQTIRMQRNGGFEFDQQINMSVTGKVGEKLQVTANFDNNNSFDFQNNMKIEYTGFKEDILQKLEIGNVSLPLNNTLIQGAQNLFGIKAQMQFGKLMVTTIATTQRGKASSIDIGGGNGGGQGRPFEIIASNYDDNRHFFLGHFFRDNYRKWISNIPQIISGVNITRVEVYVLNRNNDTQTMRNAIALMDLGEPRRVYNNTAAGALDPRLPNANAANQLYSRLTDQSRFPMIAGARGADGANGKLEPMSLENGTDYEKITGARKLAPTEFTYHQQLGYITLTRKLQNDEVLAVAYEYTYNGRAYKVGELSEDYSDLRDDDVILLKMLRPRKVAIRDQQRRIIPTWDLMMKNIYNLNVNQLSREDFQLRVIYRDARTGVDNPQLQDGGETIRARQLLDILGLDRLNPVNDPGFDGNFDYVEGITINSSTGQIIFPYLEPFSEGLREAFASDSRRDYMIQKYSYDTLYRSTKADAELYATKNKFWLVGTYSAGSSKEILIPGFGVSQGSVKLYAGGMPLTEGSDYVVDYTFGKVTILNESILSSNKEIQVQYEQSDPFAFQTRSLLGSRFDYKLSEDVNFGSTLLYYNERPMISRNQIGTEPARNVQYGFDFNINKKSRLLTKIVDALPFLETKEQSAVNFTGEFAQLLPGTSNIIDGEGTGYIDDFENTATPYTLMNPTAWKLAATPKTSGNAFGPSNIPVGSADILQIGYKRAKLAWYQVDNQFYRDGGAVKPSNISKDDIKNHYVRPVGPQEIFPAKQLTQGVFWEQIFDVAYYPRERGPYNYNPTVTADGFLPRPEENWGGITTAIKTEVDFDKANIEYVEFWLLDPFINSPQGVINDGISPAKRNETGGKLIFHLGSISEDVARDGKHAFENGLPRGENDLEQATKNAWGYVASDQYVTNAFDLDAGARARQDVGFDGVTAQRETDTFQDYLNQLSGLNPEGQARIQNDPSADNFQYFLGDELDNRDAKILERYKNINGIDGNSPVANGSSDLYTPAGSTIPDNEDLNADNTLSELEEYYSYNIDLAPGGLAVGRKYIVDKITTDNRNEAGEQVNWYLYRIPVREFEDQYGNIEGFKSVRYARMVLTGFREPVVLRFANFRMVGSRWRRYTNSLQEGGIAPTPELTPEDFTVSVVNLEENGKGNDNKSPYVIPPGVVRDRDNTSSVSRLLNEQSVQLCADAVKDGDARSIYKNVSFDLFNYGRVKMYFHAHGDAADNDLRGFIRLGKDLDSNYYEIEVPLKMTNISDTDPVSVWPDENQIDLALDELYRLKADRDREGVSMNILYPQSGHRIVGYHGVRIFGRPDLTEVQSIMIGVRNPRTPDKRAFQVCLWANELRVTDFNRTPGWAVNATMSAKLADFATLTGAVRHTSFGFGSVSSKIGERTREETTGYDISANVNVDKLLPGNTGIKIPMFVSYENTTITPLYDPANPDLKLDAALQSLNEDDRKNYLNIARDRTVGRSINFVNVRKVKVNPDAKTHLWDIENLAFSYSYSDRRRTNFTMAELFEKQYRGSVAYTYSPKATGIEPFKNAKGLSSPWLKAIKDFNISFLPSSLSARMDLDRSLTSTIYRNSAGYGKFIESRPNYMKYFTFTRQYNLRWNISKGLSLEYSSRADAVIDEPENEIDGEVDTQPERNYIIKNIKKLGRMKNFTQNVTVNYTLPLDKIPVTDWIGAEYRHQITYGWKAGPVNYPDELPPEEKPRGDILDAYDFKNTIQNSQDQNFSGRLDMLKLYNKVKILKDLNTPKKPSKIVTNPRLQKAAPKPDTTKTKAPAEVPGAVKGLLRLLMSVRSINGTYTVTRGTMLTGFEPSPKFFGMDQDWNAPGWDFVLGSQNPNIRHKAAAKGWLTKNESLTTPFTQTRTENINLRANVEPSPDLKIQLDLKKETNSTFQSIFRYDTANQVNEFRDLSPSRGGSYRISTINIRTAFNSSNDKIVSAVFQDFEQNLEEVRQRFNIIYRNNPTPDTTESQYKLASQDVLIPAFIAAYTGSDAKRVNLSPFPKIPMPNWRIDYTGLNKLGMFKDIFSSITLSHAYQASYSVVNYQNSLEFSEGGDVRGLELDRPITDYNVSYYGQFFPRDNTGTNNVDQLVPVYIISQVLISEQFSPLIGVNMRTKGRLSANFQYKTKRDLALTVSNAQVTELSTKDFSFELGYTKNNMKLPFKSQGRTVVLKNDVTFRMNVSVADTKTIQRKIYETNIITNGNINFQLRPNISYVVNQKLNIQLYFERTINEPLVSNSYRRATTRFGTQIRFSLAQ